MKFYFSFATVLLAILNFAYSQQNILPNQQRLEAHLAALSKFGTNPQGGVSRLGFSEAAIQGRKYVIELMKQAGLDVHIDAREILLAEEKAKTRNCRPLPLGRILIRCLLAEITMAMSALWLQSNVLKC